MSYQEYTRVLRQMESEYFSQYLEPVRDWLRPHYGDEAWIKICDEIELKYRQRSVSRALVSLCVFHDERTPSFWMYPSGNFNCYGCSTYGDIATFILTPKTKRLEVQPDKLLRIFGRPPDDLCSADPVFENLRSIPSFGQMILEGLDPMDRDEEPF